MRLNFYPKEYINSVYEHDFSYYADYGFRVILFDIDNTLVLHDDKATDLCKFFIYSIKNMGYKVGVLSNNILERVVDFAQDTNMDFFIADAKKPSPNGLFRVCNMFSIRPEQIILVGDQIFTDMLCGNAAGAHTILTKPLGKEKYFHITLKRILEKPFLFLIKQRLKKHYVRL